MNWHKLEAQWLKDGRNWKRLHEATKGQRDKEHHKVARTTIDGDKLHMKRHEALQVEELRAHTFKGQSNIIGDG